MLDDVGVGPGGGGGRPAGKRRPEPDALADRVEDVVVIAQKVESPARAVHQERPDGDGNGLDIPGRFGPDLRVDTRELHRDPPRRHIDDCQVAVILEDQRTAEELGLLSGRRVSGRARPDQPSRQQDDHRHPDDSSDPTEPRSRPGAARRLAEVDRRGRARLRAGHWMRTRFARALRTGWDRARRVDC